MSYIDFSQRDNIVKCQIKDMTPEYADYCKHAVIRLYHGDFIVICDCPGRAKSGDCLKCGGV